MSIFDSLKRQVKSQLKREATKIVKDAAQNIGKGRNRSETFSFSALPMSLDDLKNLPEASLDSAFKTTALTLVALCRYEQDPAVAFEMLDFLKGPENVSTYEKQFIAERLKDREYKINVIKRFHFPLRTAKTHFAIRTKCVFYSLLQMILA